MSHSEDHYQNIADRRRMVASLYREGLSIRDTAIRLHTSSRTIQRDRVALGLSDTLPPPMSSEELNAARQMLEEGMHYAEIARTLKRSHRVLVKHLPGHSCDKYQIAQFAALGRRMAKIG